MYAPRLIVVDLKGTTISLARLSRIVLTREPGSFGTLRKTNDLYEEIQINPENQVEWSGPVRVHSSDSLPKNAFLEHLDKEPVEVRCAI